MRQRPSDWAGVLRVDVRWWHAQSGVTGRWSVGAHQVAVGLAMRQRAALEIRHAALPHAVFDDGVVAHLCKWVVRPSRINASCAGWGCRGDQPARHQRGSQSGDDVSVYRALLSRRVIGSVVDMRRWVIEGETPRMQVRPHHITAIVGCTISVRVAGQAAIAIPPYWQRARAGGAALISPTAISAAASTAAGEASWNDANAGLGMIRCL